MGAFGARRRRGAPLGALELVGALLFLVGTYLNVWPEYARHLWKAHPENAGRLYTGGWFAVCRHINYFGEALSFVGFALVTAARWNLWVPLVMGEGSCLVPRDGLGCLTGRPHLAAGTRPRDFQR